METETPYRIILIASAAALWALCAASLIRLLLSEQKKTFEKQRALLDFGLFVALISATFIAREISTVPIAAGIAVGGYVVALLTHRILARRWIHDEITQRAMLTELHATISYLEENLLAATTPKLLCAQAAREFDLTRREEEILLLLSCGSSYAQVAENLFLSPNTVKTHIRNLYQKMGASDRVALKQSLQNPSSKHAST